MASYVITPPDRSSLAVQDSKDRFPVRRVFCVGRNYAAHAREMGHDPDREPPFFFSKPADSVVESGSAIPYPPLTEDLHYEIELVVAIGRGGSDIPPDQAMGHVWGATVGIDLTRRDLQGEAKKRGRPWDWGKAFDHSAPMGPLCPVGDIPSLVAGRIWLAVNGTVKQDADLSEQIWPVADTIAFLSHSVEIAPGDLVMTGTPEGVGAIRSGDVVTGGIDGISEVEVSIL